MAKKSVTFESVLEPAPLPIETSEPSVPSAPSEPLSEDFSAPSESIPTPAPSNPTPLKLDDEGEAPGISQAEFVLGYPASPGQIAAALKGKEISSRPRPTLPAHSFGTVTNPGPIFPPHQQKTARDHNDKTQLRKANREFMANLKLKIKDSEGNLLSLPEELLEKVAAWLEWHGASHLSATRISENGELSCVSNLGQKCKFWLDTSET